MTRNPAMGKLSYEKKMWIHTFRKISFGYQTIIKQIFPHKIERLAW